MANEGAGAISASLKMSLDHRLRKPRMTGLILELSSGLFQQAKDSGDIERAKGYGRWLQRQFNWEYGEGPGGWPYIKAHSRSIVDQEPAPTTRRLSPQELAEASRMEGYFDRARNSGQIAMMKDIGQNLKNDYGYEYGIGDGGWPYIKAPSSHVIPIDEAGLRVRKEAVARQIAMDRAEREEHEAAAHDTRGPIRRGAEGFFNALKAKLGDIEAGIGRGVQTVEESADYYKPEAVAARYLKKRAEGSAPAISPREPYFGEQLKGRGEDIAASARHHQDIYGQDLASQAGWVLGDATANVGAGMLGGPYGVGILDATAAYGRGEPLQQALGTGVISTASLEAGGGLGGALEERAAASPLTQYFGRAGQPVARYLGRSTGYAVGPQAVSIPGTAVVYGKPQIPNSAKEAALDIAQALGFGFLPGRGAAVKRIAINPGTAPDVRAALHAILNGEIPPRGAPEYSITRGRPSRTNRSEPAKALVRTSPEMKEALTSRGVAGDNKSIMLRGPNEEGSGNKGSSRTDPHNKGSRSLEYNIAPHRRQPKPSQPYASHHGIQKKYLVTNVEYYEPKDDPTIMLKQGKGSPHSKIPGE